MKSFTFLLTMFSMCFLVAAQHTYEPSSTHPFGLPNPNAPAAIKDYEPMIGICDCQSTSRKPDGTWAEPVEMTWEFRYIMNGMAVQDLTLKSNGAHAGSIRQYNADSSRWYVHYYAAANPTPKLGSWQGGMKGQDIVLNKRQKAPNGADGHYRLNFHDITSDGFNWRGEWVSIDESIIYPTWTIRCKKRKS